MINVSLVDAFTSQKFGGNPAAVFQLGDEAPSDEWLVSMTREFNCEAAFLGPSATADYRLRFFTSSGEDPFCGHGTLSSAHILYEQGLVDSNAGISFETVSGPFSARKAGGSIELNLPAETAVASSPPTELFGGLGITEQQTRFVGKNRMDYLVELESEDSVRSLQPTVEILAALTCRGVIVTARADARQPFDVVSRFFAPGIGIVEDNATGSAHCALAPHWANRFDGRPMRAHQASPRGAFIEMELALPRVVLRGQAVTVMNGSCESEH